MFIRNEALGEVIIFQRGLLITQTLHCIESAFTNIKKIVRRLAMPRAGARWIAKGILN